jgi:tRNA (mo5U34)-methyltransferase
MNHNFDNWRSLLEEYENNLFSDKKDKRLQDWIQILTDLPSMHSSSVSLNNKVSVFGSWNGNDQQIANKLLLKLLPWRKGPFLIQDIFIDSEWKSDLKWTRFLDLGVNLLDKTILDVGSGNGYYAFRMLEQGAKNIICLEPNLNFYTQFLAINNFFKVDNLRMIPERIESLKFSEHNFDVIFSMGLLYHQRNPQEHLQNLKDFLKSDGQMIIETIIAPDSYGIALELVDRYASMPNVHFVHTDLGCRNSVRL